MDPTCTHKHIPRGYAKDKQRNEIIESLCLHMYVNTKLHCEYLYAYNSIALYVSHYEIGFVVMYMSK